ncbi:MAG: 16S rRNA (adenine(1518)-N(6)/adenine(1519)-N(6))-dimethyltransferase RsmA [Candidatus Omnitrophota bacterium]
MAIFLSPYNNFRPKKSLGQNFLIDNNIERKIVNEAQISPGDIVLEVGAGKGSLTGNLLETGATVFAVEIDKRLVGLLKEKFSKRKNFHLKEADILSLNLSEFNFKKKITLIGNLPFNISSQIITKFLAQSFFFDKFFVTVQKELAQRMIAAPGSRESSVFGLYVQFFSEPKIIFNIKRTCFRPSPKVDASFLSLNIRDPQEISQVDVNALFAIIKAAFNLRRKTIANALAKRFSWELVRGSLEKADINNSRRAETITLREYIRLADALKSAIIKS